MTSPYFIVEKAPGGGFQHRNIGTPLGWIVGPGQTCRWYKFKRDAVAAAERFNAESK